MKSNKNIEIVTHTHTQKIYKRNNINSINNNCNFIINISRSNNKFYATEITEYLTKQK